MRKIGLDHFVPYVVILPDNIVPSVVARFLVDVLGRLASILLRLVSPVRATLDDCQCIVDAEQCRYLRLDLLL